MRAAKFGRSTVTRLMTINSVPRCPIDGTRERVCPGPYRPEQRPSLLGPLGMATGFIHDAAEPPVNLWDATKLNLGHSG
jgi:hypothetical protein